MVQTEFEYVAWFVPYRSSKCVWFDQKSQFRVSLAQRAREVRVVKQFGDYTEIFRTNRPYGHNIHFTDVAFGHFVATLVLFYPM